MKLNSIQTLIGTAATTACLLSMTGVAQAGTFVNGWNYARDYFNDGTGDEQTRTGLNYKVSAYEMYGMAVHQDRDTITVAFNGNTGLAGRYNGTAKDQNIGWGDFLFNLGGVQYGVHFSETNDSFGGGNTTKLVDDKAQKAPLGLYKNVTTKNVAAVNHGWSNVKAHHDYTKNRAPNVKDAKAGIAKSFGDVEMSEMAFYAGSNAAPTSIKSGTKVDNDNFQLLNQTQLGALGLNFSSAFGVKDSLLGTETFGFSFTKTQDMVGEFFGHVFYECTNDGIAIQGEIQSVPEPSAISGLAILGLILAGSKLRQHG